MSATCAVPGTSVIIVKTKIIMATKEEKIKYIRTRIEERISSDAASQEKKYGEMADKYVELIDLMGLNLGADGRKFIRGAFMDGLSFSEL